MHPSSPLGRSLRGRLSAKSSPPTSRGGSFRRRKSDRSEGCAVVASVLHSALNGKVSFDNDAPLMQAGVKSVDVPVVARELAALFEQKIPASWIFQYSTVREMANVLFAPLFGDLERGSVLQAAPTKIPHGN